MARTRLQAAALRGLTRFVGGDAEVEHLRRVLDQVGAGRGQVIAIVGEVGVGKSRLLYELTHSHRVQRRPGAYPRHRVDRPPTRTRTPGAATALP